VDFKCPKAEPDTGRLSKAFGEAESSRDNHATEWDYDSKKEATCEACGNALGRLGALWFWLENQSRQEAIRPVADR
jgi:hypothetical protein